MMCPDLGLCIHLWNLTGISWHRTCTHKRMWNHTQSWSWNMTMSVVMKLNPDPLTWVLRRKRYSASWSSPPVWKRFICSLHSSGAVDPSMWYICHPILVTCPNLKIWITSVSMLQLEGEEKKKREKLEKNNTLCPHLKNSLGKSIQNDHLSTNPWHELLT